MVKMPNTEWKKEWTDMPEFVQEKLTYYATIVIRFEEEKDLIAFSRLVEQNLTSKTKSMWYPYKPIKKITKEWRDKILDD